MVRGGCRARFHERLRILFFCAHPAIGPAARTPLMLQPVLGLDAGRIASAFLTSPAAMSQRLLRARTRIRDAGIPFDVPDGAVWPERLTFVPDAIYAAFTSGWDALPDAGAAPHDLALEAIWLARVLIYLVPDEPEALGLLALLLHSESRHTTRQAVGEYIPLPDQDPSAWDAILADEAETLLHRGALYQTPVRFQLQAAIQSVHAARRYTGTTHWPAIAALYETLLQHTGSLRARIGHAIALSHGSGARLAALNVIASQAFNHHQPRLAARAHLLHQLGRTVPARAAWQYALGLTTDPAVREYLLGKLTEA